MQNDSDSYTYNQFESHCFKRTHSSLHAVVTTTKMIPEAFHTRHKQYSSTFQECQSLESPFTFLTGSLLLEVQPPQLLAYFTFKFNFRHFYDKSK